MLLQPIILSTPTRKSRLLLGQTGLLNLITSNYPAFETYILNIIRCKYSLLSDALCDKEWMHTLHYIMCMGKDVSA